MRSFGLHGMNKMCTNEAFSSNERRGYVYLNDMDDWKSNCNQDEDMEKVFPSIHELVRYGIFSLRSWRNAFRTNDMGTWDPG